jgi:hypothetical protein
MTAVEWLVYELVFEENDNSIKHNKEIIKKAKEMERNQIIRACNYSEMKHDELLKQAIKERRTIGEIYYDKIIKK